MSKRFRQGQILNVIREKAVFTQEEIAAELKLRGVAATQVTLSRDLRDLNLVKTQSGYREIAAEDPGVDLASVAREFVTDNAVRAESAGVADRPRTRKPRGIRA